MTVHDGGMLPTRSFCNGLWNLTQAAGLPHRLLRRSPREVALYARVSTTRQHPPQTIAPPRSRLRDDVATHPDWSVADEHIDRDDG